MRITIKQRILVFVSSLVVAGALFLTVSTTGGSSTSKLLSASSAQEGVYVIDSPKITYNYDKTKYELASLSSKPYVVVKGDKQLLNLLKFSGHPKFTVDLAGKVAGSYRLGVDSTGIDKKLDVEVYPNLLDLRLMEQETYKFQPIIEVINDDVMSSKYVVSAPELLKEEVLVRDTQKKLSSIGQIKGVVDVSRLSKTSDVLVDLKVFDRDGHEIKVNLLNKAIKVRVPVEKRIVVVQEDVVKKILIEKKDKEQPKVSVKKPVKVKKPVVVEQKEKPEQKKQVVIKPKVEIKKPKQEGVLSFTNIPKDLLLENKTPNLKWSSDFKVDLKDFKEGVYEMTVNDNNDKKVLRFELVLKEPLDEDKPVDDSNNNVNEVEAIKSFKEPDNVKTIKKEEEEK